MSDKATKDEGVVGLSGASFEDLVAEIIARLGEA